MIGIAILVMIVVTLAVHLGLPQAITGVAKKIADCPKCTSFWCTLAVTLYAGADIVVAVLLSTLMGYMSSWFALVLILLNKAYDKIWERLRK